MPTNTQIKRCQGPKCTRAASAKSYCQTHYTQWRKGKTLTPIHERGDVQNCIAHDCTNKARAKGLCASHYGQKMRGKQLTYIKPRDSSPRGPMLARLPLLERLGASTSRDKSTGCLRWTRATNSAGSGVFNIDGRTTVVNNVAYDLFLEADIGSKRVLKACGDLSCIEPAHMYVKGVTKDWELLDAPFYTAREVKDPEGAKWDCWRLVRSINGLDVSRSSLMPKQDVTQASRVFFGSIDEQRPTDDEWRMWTKYLTLQRMGNKTDIAVHPLH